MSNVNMVEVLFSIDANDETIAADSAANIMPFNPVGIKLEISHGYALSFRVVPSLDVNALVASGFSVNITYAIIPGTTTMSGIIIFNAAANAIPF